MTSKMEFIKSLNIASTFWLHKHGFKLEQKIVQSPSLYQTPMPHMFRHHMWIIQMEEVQVRDQNDMWSMDLPLTVEGLTLMIWPKEGEGMAFHVKYDEVLLRTPRLVNSGGIPGRYNRDAFHLHGALGGAKYLAEIDGEAKIVKDNENDKSYQDTHTYPSAAGVIKALEDRYNQ